MKSRNAKFVALALIAALALPFTVVAANGEYDPAPYVATFSKSSLAGDSVTFSEEDFASHIVGDAELQGIVITALPLPGAGVLCLGERELLVGEAVTSAMLSNLYFKPAGVGDLSSNFSFIPVFSSGAGVGTTISVSTLRKQNHAPITQPAEYETIKNIAVTCTFPASDADGDEMIFTIVSEPRKGTLSMSADNPGSFVYTPAKNKTGTDSFTFTATDPSGAVSDVAKITIKITKNAAKMTYADMDENPAHYAALKLAAEGVLIGQRIGDGYYFSPTNTVSRGEFVAMAVTCLGIKVDSSVRTSGFADDKSTPAWVKPYLAAAREAGIIAGSPDSDGKTVFNASDAITRAEAATILAKAAELDKAAMSVENITDIEYVPAWAEASMQAATAHGILSVYADGTLRPMSAVDRADAAEMLVSAMKFVR